MRVSICTRTNEKSLAQVYVCVYVYISRTIVFILNNVKSTKFISSRVKGSAWWLDLSTFSLDIDKNVGSETLLPLPSPQEGQPSEMLHKCVRLL